MIVTASRPRAAEAELPLIRSACGTMARGLLAELEDPRRRAFWAGYLGTFFVLCARGIRKGYPGPLAVVLLAELAGLAAEKVWELGRDARATRDAIQTIAAATQATAETALGREQ